MADKAISDLTAAETITASDNFLVEQGGTAKRVTGQLLINWLTAAADGHGGISKIEKLGAKGLVDTYRITLADTTTFDFTVTNGEKGDKGDNAYVWVKYASQEPTEESHSFGDTPDDWMGVYVGNMASAPDDWTLYKWFEIKGEKGKTGDPATLVSHSVSYQVGTSANEIPDGEWESAIPEVPQGNYLWTKVVQEFNSGDPVTFYSVSRMGIDGLGTLRTINGLSADENGNLNISAITVGALPITGGALKGQVNANGNSITGLPEPTADSDAVPYSLVKNLEETIWENASTNSEFPSQTLTIAYEGTTTDNVRIYFEDVAVTYRYRIILSDIPTDSQKVTYFAYSYNAYRLFRCYRTDEQSITFYFSSATGSTSVTDAYVVPTKIIRIKKVT